MTEGKSQTARILAWLKSGKTITPLEALEKFGCLRLSGRIQDIEAKGHKIQNLWHVTETGKRVAKYKLVK